MVETIEKAALLDRVQSAYEYLNMLLASLSKEQKTTPGVNSSRSVKDNVAHITACQDLLPARHQNLIAEKPPAKFLPEFKTEDEVNEYLYQQNKDRPRTQVEATFQNSYQRAFAAVESLSEEELNAPVPGSTQWTVWRYINGETCEHYEEHGSVIGRAPQGSATQRDLTLD